MLNYIQTTSQFHQIQLNFTKAPIWIKNKPFLKTWFATFDWSKNTFDRSNVTVILTHFGTLFRSIEKHTESIEMGRGSLNFEKNHSLERQTKFWKTTPQSIKLQRQNAWVWDGMLFQKPKILNPNFLKNKFQSFFLWIFSNNKYVVHKSQDNFKLGWSDQKHTH